MTRNQHFIIQTGYVPFFAQIADKSTAFLKLANKHDRYIVIKTIPEMEKVADMLNETGHDDVHVVDCLDLMGKLTIRKFVDSICSVADWQQFDCTTLNIFNGSCNAFLEMEHAHVDTAKHLLSLAGLSTYFDMPFEDIAKTIDFNVYRRLILLQSIIIELLKNLPNYRVNNWIEDPLQNKLLSYDISHECLAHFYFHYLDDLYAHPVYSKFANEPEKQHKVFVNFDFSPSQEFPYMAGKTAKDIIDTSVNEKRLNFVFALTNVWKDRQERTGYINELMHYHNSAAIADGFVFRFYSRNAEQQSMSDKLLPYETYLECIKRAKYTLTVPSYDTSCFSFRRFFESIALGCIPLIHEDCKLNMFPHDFRQFIQSNLLVKRNELHNLKTIVEAKSVQYQKELEALLNTEFIQQYMQESFYVPSMQVAKLIHE